MVKHQSLPCGESGIRTRVPLVAVTRSPGVRLSPLGHLSFKEPSKNKAENYENFFNSKL